MSDRLKQLLEEKEAERAGMTVEQLALRRKAMAAIEEAVGAEFGADRVDDLKYAVEFAVMASMSFVDGVTKNAHRNDMRTSYMLGFVVGQLHYEMQQNTSPDIGVYIQRGMKEGRRLAELSDEVRRKLGLATQAEVAERMADPVEGEHTVADVEGGVPITTKGA